MVIIINSDGTIDESSSKTEKGQENHIPAAPLPGLELGLELVIPSEIPASPHRMPARRRRLN